MLLFKADKYRTEFETLRGKNQSLAAVLDCLRESVRRAEACALMVTHSRRAAAAADRVLQLAGGRLQPA